MTEGEELYPSHCGTRVFNRSSKPFNQLSAKRDELNQNAGVIGKPQVDNDEAELAKIELPKTEPKTDRPDRKPTVQIVDRESPGSIPASRNTIALALTGRGLGR
jgi:hypothetical protein